MNIVFSKIDMMSKPKWKQDEHSLIMSLALASDQSASMNETKLAPPFFVVCCKSLYLGSFDIRMSQTFYEDQKKKRPLECHVCNNEQDYSKTTQSNSTIQMGSNSRWHCGPFLYFLRPIFSSLCVCFFPPMCLGQRTFHWRVFSHLDFCRTRSTWPGNGWANTNEVGFFQFWGRL